MIGLNYENPLDTAQQSKISFGTINYNEIENGSKGLRYYQNLALDAWGILMDDVKFNGVDMTGGLFKSIGFIDSGNTSIQLPNTVFENVKTEMRKTEKSIGSMKIDEKNILVANTPCDHLYDTM